MPLQTFPALSGVYHDQTAFMQAVASAVSDPKKVLIVLEGAATLARSIALNTTVWIQRVTLSNGATAMAASANTTAIDFSQYDNVTPTKVGNTIAAKAAGTALGASLSLALALSTTATDMVVAAANQLRATKTIVGTQADCVVEFEYYDVIVGFTPS